MTASNPYLFLQDGTNARTQFQSAGDPMTTTPDLVERILNRSMAYAMPLPGGIRPMADLDMAPV